MGSLREVKNRIGTVQNTRKITSAMRMVSSAKLTKVEQLIANKLPYQQKLEEIVAKILNRTSTIDSPFITERRVQKEALVVMASNSSLCGGFNSSVIKEAEQFIAKHAASSKEQLLIYPIGRKIEEYLVKRGHAVQGSYQDLADKPSYKMVKPLAKELMHKFLEQEVDRVYLIYYHFQSVGTQSLLTEQYLPLNLEGYRKGDQGNDGKEMNYDYIVEPSEEELIADLIPQVLSQKLYTAVVDSKASSEAARSMAMQVATDNADSLIQDLTKQYNKSRQQAITNELLDIIGGSMR